MLELLARIDCGYRGSMMRQSGNVLADMSSVSWLLGHTRIHALASSFMSRYYERMVPLSALMILME
jgi:hypothetical protein